MRHNIEKEILNQNHQYIAKTITLIENDSPQSDRILSKLYPPSDNSYRIGITGPPGSGKSTITDQLISKYKKKDFSIAILCIDPTSPFSGGAILGDRIRMLEHHIYDNIFIRSIASRNSAGGLSSSIEKVANLLDSAGFDIIIIETVGIGQIELDIVKTADSIVVILNPESGDDIQILKAGLMEIGDIFVVNKADRSGSDKLFSILKNYAPNATHYNKDWSPPVIKTIATNGNGIDELVDSLEKHKLSLHENGIIERKKNERYMSSVKYYLRKIFFSTYLNEQKIKCLHSEVKLPHPKRRPPQKLAEDLFSSNE